MSDPVSENADHLLDSILKSAQKEEKKDFKKEVVKQEVTVKQERGTVVKTERSFDVDGDDLAMALVKAETTTHVKSELVKKERASRSRSAKKKRSKSRKRSRSAKKKRSRSRKKRSRSRKRRRRRSSSSSSQSVVGAAMAGLPQARVVAIRGHWAQYLSPAGETFYKNVLNGEVQWQKPGDFDCTPSRRAGEMTPGPGENAVYIFHMPPEWAETDLMQLFSPFGQVQTAHVQRDANGFSRSCGFITYTSRDGAEQAVQMMNGFGVDGKFLKVSLTQFSVDGGPMLPGATPMGAAGAMSGLQSGGIMSGMQTGGGMNALPARAPGNALPAVGGMGMLA